jgi:hypothetical protein
VLALLIALISVATHPNAVALIDRGFYFKLSPICWEFSFSDRPKRCPENARDRLEELEHR